MEDIKMIKGTRKLNEEELSNISGGAEITVEGVTCWYPGTCPICNKPVDPNNSADHELWYDEIKHKAISIRCKIVPGESKQIML